MNLSESFRFRVGISRQGQSRIAGPLRPGPTHEVPPIGDEEGASLSAARSLQFFWNWWIQFSQGRLVIPGPAGRLAQQGLELAPARP